MRKRAGVLDVLNHFPDARFFLVGDSGEQDLELYAEIARERPDQILGVFIRDASARDDRALRPLDDPTGAAAYRAQGFRDWVVGGHTAGQVKSAGLLTFATVFGAGHMMSVPAVILAAVGRVLTRLSASTFRWTSRRRHRL